MARENAACVQTQVRFERLLQETGGARPRGMHFCYSADALGHVWEVSRGGILRTAHGGQLARFVGSPVMFVAATADRVTRKKAETRNMLLPLIDNCQCEQRYNTSVCCYTSKAM